jgi:hypothetical protein
MSMRETLNLYIAQLERRLRLGAALRGAAVLTSVALAATVVLVLIANALAFSRGSVVGSRVILLFVMVLVIVCALAIPLRRITRRGAAARAEKAFPKFQQRLTTFAERDAADREPFIELLAADTLEVARGAEPETFVPRRSLMAWLALGAVSLGVLVWMVVAGPGFLGYGSALLWEGSRAGITPIYDIRVTPGDATVRRNSDELVTAQPIGIQANTVRIYARSQSSSKWDELTMQPQPGGSGFQFVFAGLPEGVEYYVEAGALKSRHYNLRVADLPGVKQIRVTYHFPSWTGMATAVDEHGGDLRAIEGTEANLEVTTDRPLRNGVLILDDGQQLQLSVGEGNRYTGTIQMAKDGSYHIAAVDEGQPVRLSEDFFIEADKANPPEIAIDRPARDYRASPIEEVTVAVKADDQFGLNNLALHYSVNGGAEQTVDLLKQKGVKEADGSTVLSLENYKLVPGDIISFYASAKDARAEAHTDMFFIEAEPFEREFSQSQAGGGGGGGGMSGDQNDISEREKEIIAETWKHQNDKSGAAQQAAEAGKFLSQVQAKLRDQAIALAGRMGMRDLNQQNDEFSAFQKDMNAAAEAMNPASDKLKQQKWTEALPNEQKALQHLLQAEATFRQIQVAFGSNAGGGAGGGAGRDLASLFDLELDTQKNQYETAQTAGSADQKQKDIDEALKKLDELARRQQDLAQQRNNNQSFEQRWQQEMLKREAEELQQRMEQLAQNQQQGSSSSSSSGQSSSGQSGQSSSGQSSGQSQNGSSSQDQQVRRALDRLRQATDDMSRAASQGQSQDSADARRAADRLREATNALGELQRQNSSGKLDAMSQEADRLSGEQRAQADRMRRLLAQRGQPGESAQSEQDAWNEVQSLARDRQQLADDLSKLESQMRSAARELAPTQHDAATKLRGTLGDTDQADLQTRLQKSADWLRRGYDPNSNSTEPQIASDLQRLADGLRGAQKALGPEQQNGNGNPNGKSGDSDAALDNVQRLRNQMVALSRDLGGRNPGNSQSGQAGRNGQNGQGGQQGGLARNSQQGGGPGGNYGAAIDDGYRQGYDPGRLRGGGNNNWYIDTGNNSNLPQPAAPDNSPVPGDPERAFQQALNSVNELNQSVEDDPEIAREVQDLVRQMQKLDPKRFPGNPALFDQLHSQILNQVNDLELQLQRKLEQQNPGQVRSADSKTIPAGYQDAVADYYRRLSKNQNQ